MDTFSNERISNLNIKNIFDCFSSKTKELLVDWKINELKRLKEDAPELFQSYQEKIGNKKAP